jgi:serine/threonine protein phosphatase 1
MGYTFVVGDIHGCSDLLRDLLDQIEVQFTGDDRLVFLGDYIDRGSDSRGVIELILGTRTRMGERVACLKGNHEQWLIEAFHNPTCSSWLMGMGGLTTVRSYSPQAADALEASLELLADRWASGQFDKPPLPYESFFQAMPPRHVEFFLGMLQLTYEDRNVICAHAGLNLACPIEEQSEVDVLWSDPVPLLDEWKGPKTLVVGHTQTHSIDPAMKGKPLVKDHMVCLDTGCYGTGILSAMRFPDRTPIQSGTARQA